MAGLTLSACNPASHYESAANIGKSRVELAPLLTEDDLVSEPKARQQRKSVTPTVKTRPVVRRAESGAAKQKTALAKPGEKSELRPSLLAVLTGKKQAAAKDVQPKGGVETDLDLNKAITTTHAFAANGKQADLSKWSDLRRMNVQALEDAFRPNGDYFRTVKQIENTSSAKCRRILAETGITTTLLRSPSLSANIDDDANYGFGASFDFVDLQRANLEEELALARCYRLAIGTRLTQLLVSSSQALTRSGYLAKAHVLRSKRGQFRQIRQEIEGSVATGNLTLLHATTLRQYLDQVATGEAKARGEASRREIVDRLIKRSFKGLDKQLVSAERRIADIERRRRTVDAIKVRGQLSYGNKANFGTDTSGGSFSSTSNSGREEVSGTVQVSLRLGAFYKRRHELENVLQESSGAQHFEVDSGIFWRTSEMAKANERALSNLHVQRRELLRAIAQAERNARQVAKEYAEDLIMPRLRAKIDLISLRANLAGINATIADTKRINKKLRYKG